jgi:hypothetical protein
MKQNDLEDAIKQAWERWHGPVHQDEGDGFTPSVSPVFRQGFKDGFALAEQKMREALRGHKSSQLWGEHGLIAATMRCVDALQRKEEEKKTEGMHRFTEEEKEALKHALMPSNETELSKTWDTSAGIMAIASNSLRATKKHWPCCGDSLDRRRISNERTKNWREDVA